MTDRVPSHELLMIVEDEAMIREMLTEVFEEGGFDVMPVADGSAALAVLQQKASDLCALVTDVNLGGADDGWCVARAARELAPRISVVYITGDSGHRWAAQGVPNSILLQKPFPPGRLVAAGRQPRERLRRLRAAGRPPGAAALIEGRR